jgi:trans-aconitate methyltransferase
MATTPHPDWDPTLYAANARFVSDLGQPVVDSLAPRPDECILDLGCGDGALTARLLEIGCRVIGVDASPGMVATARARGVDARVMAGQSLSFDAEFDAVFSNAALHWMQEPRRVVDGVWRALRPGGRFVAEMGGRGNVGSILAASEAALARRGLAFTSPWYFPDVAEYRQMLETRGFAVTAIELFERPTPLPGDIRGWLDTFGQPFLGALDPATRKDVTDEILAQLRPQLCDADGRWIADYVRLRFSAHRPQ